MNLKAIAAHLIANRVGREGETLFVTEMPRECREGILLMNGPHGTPIDHELPGWRNTGFRIIVRAADYGRGLELANRASDALTLHHTTVMTARDTSIEMRQSLPFNEPRPYRRSEGGYWEFEVEIDCKYIQL